MKEKLIEQLVAATIVDRTAPYTLATDDGIRLVAQLLSYVRVPVPESVRTESNAVGQVERVVPTTTDVFIIHGHDLTNALRLRTLLRERLNLNPIVLNERPGKGRTLPRATRKGGSFRCSLLKIVPLTAEPPDPVPAAGASPFCGSRQPPS